jgi:hypothetical protein
MKLLILGLALAGGLFANDLDDHYTQLKDAQAKKDPDAVLKLAVESSKLAKTEAATVQPAAAGEVADWKQRVDFAKQVDKFAEYSLASVAIGLPDQAKVEALVNALIEMNPKSEYLTMCSSSYLAAFAKTPDKQLAAAQKLLTANASNDDALDVLAVGYSGSSPDRANGYAVRLLTVMKGKTKAPEGVSDAEWERQKSAKLGDGYYISGTTSCAKSAWIDCDRNLRTALPYIYKDPRSLGITYFYLGLANYQLGKVTGDRSKIQEGEKFSEQSAAIAGPMQQRAAANVQAMKAELAAPRR